MKKQFSYKYMDEHTTGMRVYIKDRDLLKKVAKEKNTSMMKLFHKLIQKEYGKEEEL